MLCGTIGQLLPFLTDEDRPMTTKPRVIVPCVASRYAAPEERIIEFADRRGNGGLISFQHDDYGRLCVSLYCLGPNVVVLPPSYQ